MSERRVIGACAAASLLVLACLLPPLPADAQTGKLEAAYVVLGPQGTVARAVLADASRCPVISIDGAQQPMTVRAPPDAMFPVLVCEALIPATATSARLENTPLPLPKRTIGSIAAFGDTGCHLKAAKAAGKRKDADEAGTPANSRTATTRHAGRSPRSPRASPPPSPTSSSTSAITSPGTVVLTE